MKSGIYICLCIVLLLILMFLFMRYYLAYNYTDVVTVNDDELLDILCLKKHHDTEIFYATYRIGRGNQINLTSALNAALIHNGALESHDWVFHAEDYNLPKGGQLTFRFKCNTCNSSNTTNDTASTDTYIPKRINMTYAPYIPEFPTTHRNADNIPIQLPGNSQSNIANDSYATSAESAQPSNIVSGIGKAKSA